MINYPDLARAAFDASALPPPPRALHAALRYIMTLLGMLPASEHVGYVEGPVGGENVWPLDDGTLVRISRVMTPDGQIYKVLSDAPNGNPQWVPEDVRPDLYVPFLGMNVPIPGTPAPEPVPTLEPRLHLVETRAALLWDVYAELATQIGILNQQLADLTNRPAPPYPEYVGKLGPFTIISRPKA